MPRLNLLCEHSFTPFLSALLDNDGRARLKLHTPIGRVKGTAR